MEVFTSTPELVLSRIGNDPDPEVMMRKVNEVYAQRWQMTELQGVAGVRAEGFPSANLKSTGRWATALLRRLRKRWLENVNTSLRRSHSCLDAVG